MVQPHREMMRRLQKRGMMIDIDSVRFRHHHRPQLLPVFLVCMTVLMLNIGMVVFHKTSIQITTTTAFLVPNTVIGKSHRLEHVVIPGWSKLQHQHQQQQQPIVSSFPSLSIPQYSHLTKLNPLRLWIQSPLFSSTTECASLRRFRTPFSCRKRLLNYYHIRYNNSNNIGGLTTTRKPPLELLSSSLSLQQYHHPSSTSTTTTTSTTALSLTSGSIPPPSSSWIQLAISKFRDRPGTYLVIPIIAALVGWFTNWLAVQMIFYPIQYRGWNIYRPNPENPLGLLGWQGIIPCKTRPMSNALVDMVTTQLLTVSEAFARIDPKYIATALSPSLIPFTRDIVQTEILSSSSWSNWIFTGPSRFMNHILLKINTSLLEQVTIQLQQNAESVFQLRNCVVNQMIEQRSKLGQLFQQCGQAELNFLTNSGLWFGFLLGIIQMCVALVWDNPWSLSIGGGIVGLATNWLALKWIFEPVDPIRIGPLLLQGKFLRRQTEVAATFAHYFANQILSGGQIWNSMLTDPQSTTAISNILGEQIQSILSKCTFGLWRNPLSSAALKRITDRAIQIDLPKSVPIIFPYMDQVLGLERTLRVRMERMTSRQFERVLHPIFEEDELTLIIAGAVLGFGAGLIQQGFETNVIQLPKFTGRIGTILTTAVAAIYTRCRGWLRRNHRDDEEDDDENDHSATDI